MEHAVTEEFKLPRSNAVRSAVSEAMRRHHANPDHVFNSYEYRKAMRERRIAYWSDPKNHDAQSERKIEYYSDPKNCEALSETMKAWWADREAMFNPNAKYHTRNQLRKSGQLLKPHQCAKCGTQYDTENHAYLHHMENCKHPTDVIMTSALLLLQKLPGKLPQNCQRG